MIRFGIIGSNFIVTRFREGAAQCPDFALEAVYSRSMPRAEMLAGEWGARKAYASLAALAADKEVDAVYIASPNLCHKEQAITLMRAGKHVLCEKPIAGSLRDFEEMCRAAKENHVVLLEAMRSAFIPSLQVIREYLPKLGKIRSVNLSYCQYSSRYDKWKTGIVENAFRPELVNGALMDIGVYCVHMLVMLFGKPDRIEATARFLPDSIDGDGSILAYYKDMTARLQYAKVYDSRIPCEIAGEEGILLFSPVSNPRTLTFYPRGGEAQEVTLAIRDADMYYEIVRFCDLIKNQGDVQPYWEDSRKALSIMDEVRARTGIDFLPHKDNSEGERSFL